MKRGQRELHNALDKYVIWMRCTNLSLIVRGQFLVADRVVL